MDTTYEDKENLGRGKRSLVIQEQLRVRSFALVLITWVKYSLCMLSCLFVEKRDQRREKKTSPKRVGLAIE